MQEKLQSPILRLGLSAFLLYLVKKYLNYDLGESFAYELVDVVIGIIIIIAMYNNPNDRNKL